MEFQPGIGRRNTHIPCRHQCDSDIDVCVIADNIENNFMAMLDIAPLSIGVDTRIEPVVYSYEDYKEEQSFGLLGEVKRYGVEV